MASILFSISLSNGKSCPDDLSFCSPALLYGSNGGSSNKDGHILTFWGNGILKAQNPPCKMFAVLQLWQHGFCTGDECWNGQLKGVLVVPPLPCQGSSCIQQWKNLESALTSVEASLACDRGTNLAGERGTGICSMTIAIVATLITLLHGQGSTSTSAIDVILPIIIYSYIQVT